MNPLVKLLLDLDRASVEDALVSIEADGIATELFSEEGNIVPASERQEIWKASKLFSSYVQRLESGLSLRRKLLEKMKETEEREARSMEQIKIEVETYKKRLELIEHVMNEPEAKKLKSERNHENRADEEYEPEDY